MQRKGVEQSWGLSWKSPKTFSLLQLARFLGAPIIQYSLTSSSTSIWCGNKSQIKAYLLSSQRKSLSSLLSTWSSDHETTSCGRSRLAHIWMNHRSKWDFLGNFQTPWVASIFIHLSKRSKISILESYILVWNCILLQHQIMKSWSECTFLTYFRGVGLTKEVFFLGCAWLTTQTYSTKNHIPSQKSKNLHMQKRSL